MKAWKYTALAGFLVTSLGACGPSPGAIAPGAGSADTTPHDVTADYTPGEMSQSPSIVQARPNVVGSTLAGSGTEGGGDGSGSAASFQAPEGLAVKSDGTIYVAEPYAYRIRRIDPSGQVSTLAGGAGAQPGRSDGTGSQATFMGPKDLAIAPNGNLYVVDFDSVRRVSPTGQVSTLALKNADGSSYQPIEFFGIAIDSAGNLYLSETYWIDRVTPDGVVSRYAGNDARGFADGQAARSYFNLPRKLTIDTQGNLYVADYGNLRIRKITPGRTVSTIAGNGILGYTDGTAATSRLNFPSGLCVDSSGNVLIADTYNHSIRQVTTDGQVKTIAGNNQPGYLDGSGTMQFQRPLDVAVRPDGGIVVADSDNNRIRLLR